MTADHSDSDDTSSNEHVLAASVRTFPWLRAALAAVAVFLVEYLAVAALFVVGPSSVDRTAAPINSGVDVLIQYGHVLFNAHHVPTVTRATVQIGGSPIANDLYLATDASVPPLVYFLVPVVALLAAGALFERYRGERRAESVLEESALVGTGFTLGYLPSAVVSAVLFVQVWPLEAGGEVVGSASQGPMLLVALVAFFVFPMLCASIGAAGVAWRSRRAATGPPTVGHEAEAVTQPTERSGAPTPDDDQA